MAYKVRKDSFTPYLFLLPGFIFLAVWLIYPMFRAFQISLYDWSFVPGIESKFNHFDNYLRAFQDKYFWVALKNTLIFMVISVPGQLILGLGVALLLERIHKLRVFFRVGYYIPVITSWVIITLLFKYLFNSSEAGLVNYLLTDVFQFISEPIPWLTEAKTSIFVVCLIGIFKGVGWTMVIFLAALQAIPDDYYQAASIDGASGWQMIRYISIPLLIPTMVLVLIMLSIGAFQAYIQVALLTNGGPFHQSEVILSYMYYQAFSNRQFGYASAISFLLIAIVFTISWMQLRLFREEQRW